jgi:transglutaminase superfamily protein
MRRLKRLAMLTNVERLLLLRVWLVVWVARVSLWLMPTPIVRNVVRQAASVAHETSIEQSVWAVKVVSRYVLRATCLTQALAAQALLARAGRESLVEIGVAKNSGKFEAHAWVVCGNQIVIGGPNVERYSRLATWAV